MEWPFATATTVPSLAEDKSLNLCAEWDLVFAEDLENDVYLKEVFSTLREGKDEAGKQFEAARRTLISAFISRAQFTVHQKLTLLNKMISDVKKAEWSKKEKSLALQMLADVEELDKDIHDTLVVLHDFQAILAPHPDQAIETLVTTRQCKTPDISSMMNHDAAGNTNTAAEEPLSETETEDDDEEEDYLIVED
jgi:hypothetical protein